MASVSYPAAAEVILWPAECTFRAEEGNMRNILSARMDRPDSAPRLLGILLVALLALLLAGCIKRFSVVQPLDPRSDGQSASQSAQSPNQ